MGVDSQGCKDPAVFAGGVEHLGGVPQAGGDVDDQSHPGFPGPAHHFGLVRNDLLQVQVSVGVGQAHGDIFQVYGRILPGMVKYLIFHRSARRGGARLGL